MEGYKSMDTSFMDMIY